MDKNNLLSYIQIGGKKSKGKGKGKGKSKKSKYDKGCGGSKRNKTGGSVLADVSVPAGLLFLNEFLKRRKANSKKVKFSKKRKVTRKVNKKNN
jgi:hypothetical protein